MRDAAAKSPGRPGVVRPPAVSAVGSATVDSAVVIEHDMTEPPGDPKACDGTSSFTIRYYVPREPTAATAGSVRPPSRGRDHVRGRGESCSRSRRSCSAAPGRRSSMRPPRRSCSGSSSSESSSRSSRRPPGVPTDPDEPPERVADERERGRGDARADPRHDPRPGARGAGRRFPRPPRRDPGDAGGLRAAGGRVDAGRRFRPAGAGPRPPRPADAGLPTSPPTWARNGG